MLDARQSLTKTGTVPAALQSLPPAETGAQDMRTFPATSSLSRQIGKVSNVRRGDARLEPQCFFPATDTITSSLNAGANLVTGGIFQLNAQANVNWVAADGLTVGTSRT